MDALDLEATKGPGAYQLYMERSSAPLTGFIFALPLFIVYHAGLWWLNTFSGLRWANAVDISIANALGRLGMAGPLLSFVAVVIVFLAMHAVTGKVWHWPAFSTWFIMVVESLALALPVFLLSRLVVRLVDYLPLGAALLSGAENGLMENGSGEIAWQANLVLSCGAGVYEEFFFRILVMGIIALFLGKILGIQGAWKWGMAALLQALLFSASHHLPGSPEQIHDIAGARAALPVFTFRMLAGLYFAAIYIERGFGVAAGSHAGYDLMVVTLDRLMPLEVG